MPPAARMTDSVIHIPPVHCHAPHPAAPSPVPMPGAATPPLKLTTGCVTTVKISNQAAATETTGTPPCMLVPPCPKPGSPGSVQKGSGTVMIGGKGAARVGDPMDFKSCAGPVPATSGKIVGPGAPTVMIGG